MNDSRYRSSLIVRFLHSSEATIRAGVPPTPVLSPEAVESHCLKTWVQEDTPSRFLGYGVPPRRTCSFRLEISTFLVNEQVRVVTRSLLSRLGWREHLFRVRRSPSARWEYYIKIGLNHGTPPCPERRFWRDRGLEIRNSTSKTDKPPSHSGRAQRK